MRHLFTVAAGLDSAVTGEHEILGQIRDSWQAARSVKALLALFWNPYSAWRCNQAKKFAAALASPVALPRCLMLRVALAAKRLGGLAGQRIVVLGAGEVASGTLKSLCWQ